MAADSVHAEALFRLEVSVAVRAARRALVGLRGVEIPPAAMGSGARDVASPCDLCHGREGLPD
eukprot:4073487-Alexandrium_andersonii.AAC.1